MRRIGHTLPDLARRGPVFSVTVGLHPTLERELRRRGQAVPAPIDVEAIIDTGASHSVVRIDLIQLLGVNPTGIVPVSTPGSSPGVATYEAEYLVQIGFRGGPSFEVEVVGTLLPGQLHGCLIGRDVLRSVRFVYDGKTGEYSLDF